MFGVVIVVGVSGVVDIGVIDGGESGAVMVEAVEDAVAVAGQRWWRQRICS